MPAYLAFDLGAESGRALIGEYDGGRLRIEEIRRFENKMVEIDGHLRWNIDALFDETLKTLTGLTEDGSYDIKSLGIDTWGVDFSFTDSNGELLEWPVTYRDKRSQGAMGSYFNKIREMKFTIVPVTSFCLSILFFNWSRLFVILRLCSIGLRPFTSSRIFFITN